MHPIPQLRLVWRRTLALAGCLALIAILGLAPAASAGTTGQVQVTAGTVDLNPITLTLCDTAADFGANLDANAAASDSSDTVDAIAGNPLNNEGALYQWTPDCSSQPALLQVTAPRTWTGSVCATENGGSNSQSVASGDLRFSPYRMTDYGINAYNGAHDNVTTPPFALCGGAGTDWTNRACGAGFATGCGLPGVANEQFYYYLRVDRDDSAGSFSSVTTWSVISG